MRRCWFAAVAFALLALPVVAQAGNGDGETFWEWLVRLLTRDAGGWWGN